MKAGEQMKPINQPLDRGTCNSIRKGSADSKMFTAYAGTEGCYVLRVFFYLTNKRKNGRTLFGAKYGRT